MDGLLSQNSNLVFCLKGDGQPMECVEEWFGQLESQEDPRRRLLYILAPSKVLLRDALEKSIVVVQPGGDKGMDHFFSIMAMFMR